MKKIGTSTRTRMSGRPSCFDGKQIVVVKIPFIIFLLTLRSVAANTSPALAGFRKFSESIIFEYKHQQRKRLLQPLSGTWEDAQPIGKQNFIRRYSSTEEGYFSLSSSTVEVDEKKNSAGISTCSDEESGDASPSLWYFLEGAGQGLYASVCGAPNNFEARISVYICNGKIDQCDDLSCIAGSSLGIGCPSPLGGGYITAESSPITGSSHFDIQSPCDVHWIAEKGRTYYVRVHGEGNSDVGSFNLSIETLPNDHPLNGAGSECENEKIIQTDSISSQCQCIPNPAACGYHLACVKIDCLKCNLNLDTCGFNSIAWDIKHNGDGAKVDQTTYDSFYLVMEPKAGAKEIEVEKLSSSEECAETRDPYKVCTETKEKAYSSTANVDDGSRNALLCECRGMPQTDDVMFLCSLLEGWDYCVSDRNEASGEDPLCASVFFGQTISPFGMLKQHFRNFDSVAEKNVTVDVRQTSYDCEVFVDGFKCKSCGIIECSNGNVDPLLKGTILSEEVGIFTDMKVDCSNIEAGATYECGIAATDSFLELLNGKLTFKPSEANGEIEPGGDTPDDETPQQTSLACAMRWTTLRAILFSSFLLCLSSSV